MCQFRSPVLAASKTTHRGFQDQIWLFLGPLGRSLALPKTVIPCNTSFKNHVFQVPLITLFSVALSTRVSASGGVLASRNPSGHLFWHVDWGTCSQNSDFSASACLSWIILRPSYRFGCRRRHFRLCFDHCDGRFKVVMRPLRRCFNHLT